MRFRPVTVVSALLIATQVCAQEPAPPEATHSAAALFEPQPGEAVLACEIHPLAPVLTYRLAYRAGYSITIPMSRLLQEQGSLKILLRVRPDLPGAQPSLLLDTAVLPNAAEGKEHDVSKIEAQIKGGVYLGQGRYHMELAAVGGEKGICRKQWDLEIKPHRGVEGLLAPGRVAGSSQLGLPHPGSRAGSLTVFLHASPGRSSMVLLQSLAAVVEKMPFRRVQVVIFTLDQRKELLRQTMTDDDSFRDVAKVLTGYNPATVSYDILKAPAGHRDFLWQLLAKEGLRSSPPDAVLFLGYQTFDDSHVMVPPAFAGGPKKTAYIYFEYALPGRGPAAIRRAGRGRLRGMMTPDDPQEVWEDLPQISMRPVLPDAIARSARACSGKVFIIYSPADLVSALEKTDQLLRAR